MPLWWKTGSDQSQPVFYQSSNSKDTKDRRLDCGLRSFAVLGICSPNWSWSSPVSVFFRLQDQTSKHYMWGYWLVSGWCCDGVGNGDELAVRGHSSPFCFPFRQLPLAPFPFRQLPLAPFHFRSLLATVTPSVVFLTEPTAEELPSSFRPAVRRPPSTHSIFISFFIMAWWDHAICHHISHRTTFVLFIYLIVRL